MKLKRITFHNYRNFDHYELTLGRKVTIFIGRNGMGKTNLMDGMVQSLSFIFSKQRNTPQYEFIRSTAQGVKPFKATDPRYIHGDYTYPLSLEVVGEIANGTEPFELSWGFEQETQKSGLKDSKFREAYHAFWEYYQARDEKPVLAFYAAGFPHKDSNIGKAVKDRLKSGRPLPPSDGYYQWDKEQSCVNIWKKYYIQHWMNFRLHPTTENTRFVQAVNGVLQAFGTHINAASVVVDNPIHELAVDYREDRATLLVVLEDGTSSPFETLPAGYERIYSMVFDLACRSYLLNKHTNPEGVVLIDEIDLHLHPSLEAVILTALQRTFPRIQWLVTTHSPLVIANFNQGSPAVPPDNLLINLLHNDEGYYNRTVKHTDDILRDMQVDIASDEAINRYRLLIENGQGHSPEALELRQQLEEQLGANHEELRMADIMLQLFGAAQS